MTPEERQLLEDLASKVAQTPPPPVDQEAEDFIRKRIGSRPDALYLMTQTVLVQNMALEQAKKQIQQLQQSSPAPAQASSSFLGGQAGPRASGYGAQQNYSAPQGQQPPPPTYQTVPTSGAPSGGSTFLRGAAQTAAGVAAGALAFEGMRSLFGGLTGGFGGGPFGGGGGFGGGYGGPVDETIVNNYYDSPDQQASNDRGFDDSDNSQADDSSQDYDDSSTDDSGFDDSGSDGGDFFA